MNQEEMGQRLLRLTAYVAAMEELLVTLVNSMPNRGEIVTEVAKEGAALDSLMLNETFDDEELAAFTEARARLLALISKGAKA